MKNLFDKIFFRSNNLDIVSKKIKDIVLTIPVNQIFDAINSYSLESEIRYVGGCVRKIINNENIDDIDLATNLNPNQVCEALEKKNINYYKTGIEHGTVTALVDEFKFEITSLREDVFTDGRHAKVGFSKNWKNDASRRDFTINSIYSDNSGNLFDPFDGKKDLENGTVKFIGEADKRIKEDYLRILRYLRFFLSYSRQPHNSEIIKILKINIGGVSKLSKERLLDELKKMINLETLTKLSKDKISKEIIQIIFPEIKKIDIFSKLTTENKIKLSEKFDFIFMLSLLIIDETDNADYFLYKFNISNNDKKRIKIIDNFFKKKINSQTFTVSNLNKVFYYDGKQAVLDILNFQIVKAKKYDENLKDLFKFYSQKTKPKLPIGADILMTKYNMSEGKQLGIKLKMIEEEWVKNNFKISDQQVDNIINN